MGVPHPDDLVHAPRGDDVGPGAVSKGVHTFVNGHASHLTLGRIKMKMKYS